VEFTQYIALGDSLSIDLYPALDAGATDVAVALERLASVGNVAPIGAASLLFRNDESRWPESLGLDLVSRYPRITHRNLATDGATIGDVFGEQLPQLEESDEPTLVTLTIGGEDLFSAFSAAPKRSLLERITHDLAEAYDLLVGAIQRARPNAVLLATTVLDPSDRTGRITGILDDVGRLPLHALDTFNANVRQVASGTPGVALADAYLRFLGHGSAVPDSDRWFWRRSPLELNAQGAHELRSVWLETLDELAVG
jgi:lysophospholipase L1-like esterase